MKVIEIQGQSHVFTLTDGSTLRVFSRKQISVEDRLVSDELRAAEKSGLIRLIADKKNTPISPPKQPHKSESVAEKEGNKNA